MGDRLYLYFLKILKWNITVGFIVLNFETLIYISQEPPLPPEPEPVHDDDGNPIFIVVQVELLKPLVQKKTPETVVAR